MALTRIERRLRIKRRIRKSIAGTLESPRMSVYRSNSQIYVQFINDDESKTLAAASSKELSADSYKTKTEQAALVGELAAKKALEAGISTVVFDRNGFLYHGRIKSLAEGARKGGLKF